MELSGRRPLLKLEGYNADDTEKMLFFWAVEHINGEPEKAPITTSPPDPQSTAS